MKFETVRCVCGGQLYKRILNQAGIEEYAHVEAFDEGDRTRCSDGGTAEPKQSRTRKGTSHAHTH